MALPVLPMLLFLLTNKVVVAGIAGVLMFTLGFTFFFDKLFLVVLFGGLGYLVYTGDYDLDNVVPLIALAVLTPIMWNFFGVAQMASGFNTAPGSIVTDDGTVQPPQAQFELSDPQGQTLPGLSTTVAPQTYREVSVNIENRDDQLPLVLDSAKVIAWVGEGCGNSEVDDFELCEWSPGSTVKLQSGWLDGLGKFTLKLFDQNSVGITAQNPDDIGIWDRTTNDWKDVSVVRNFDVEAEDGSDVVALWDRSTCEQEALSSVDCSQVQSSYKFEDLGYLWADQDAEVPSQHQLSVAVLMPQSQSLTDKVIQGLTLGGIDRQDYTVITMKAENVQVATPNVQLIIIIGGLGLLLSVGAYTRVPPFNMIPTPA